MIYVQESLFIIHLRFSSIPALCKRNLCHRAVSTNARRYVGHEMKSEGTAGPRRAIFLVHICLYRQSSQKPVFCQIVSVNDYHFHGENSEILIISVITERRQLSSRKQWTQDRRTTAKSSVLNFRIKVKTIFKAILAIDFKRLKMKWFVFCICLHICTGRSAVKLQPNQRCPPDLLSRANLQNFVAFVLLQDRKFDRWHDVLLNIFGLLIFV